MYSWYYLSWAITSVPISLDWAGLVGSQAGLVAGGCVAVVGGGGVVMNGGNELVGGGGRLVGGWISSQTRNCKSFVDWSTCDSTVFCAMHVHVTMERVCWDTVTVENEYNDKTVQATIQMNRQAVLKRWWTSLRGSFDDVFMRLCYNLSQYRWF